MGTNFNPVPGSLDVIKQPANFFQKQGILVDKGDGDGVDGDFGDYVGGEGDDDCCGPWYTTFTHHGIL